MVYRDAQYINKLLLFYINKCLIIAETYDVMADTIFLKLKILVLSLDLVNILIKSIYMCK